MNSLKKVANWRPSIITSAVLLVVGISMMIFPEFFTNIFLKIIGIIGAIYGAYSLLIYFNTDEHDRDSFSNLVVGIIILLLAVALIIIPEKAMQFIIVIAGLYFIIDGVVKIPSALRIARTIKNSMVVVSISVMLPIVLGLVFIFLPINIYQDIAWLFGLCLIICSVMDILSIVHLNKLISQEKIGE